MSERTKIHLDVQTQGTLPDGKLATPYIKADGTRAFTGDQSMGGFKLTSIANGSASGDAVNYSQLSALQSIIQNFEWQTSVMGKLATPPVSPSAGDRYLIVATATGAWLGREDQIAEWSGSAWTFTVATIGTFLSIDTEADRLYLWSGTAWDAKYFEATTASTGLTKVGFDIRLDSSSAGTGLGFTSGVLSVNVDGSTLDVSGDNIIVKSGGITSTQLAAAVNTDIGLGVTANSWGNHASAGYLTSFTETDPVVKAVNGIVKSNGTTISAAVAGTDYQSPLTAGTDYVQPATLSNYVLKSGSTMTGDLSFTDKAVKFNTNSQITALQGSASATASVTYSLPPADGTSGQILSTNGAGALSWTSQSSNADTLDTLHAASFLRTDANSAVSSGNTLTVSSGGALGIYGSWNIAGADVTSSAAELNILDGVTAVASELNVLDGITSSTAELNILDGATVTFSELNILDGATVTTAELNALGTIVVREIPDGLQNDSNKDFDLDHLIMANTEEVFLNGLLQEVLEDYTLSVFGGVTRITFIDAPSATDRIRVSYRW